jgi:hypothetical protein
MPEPVFLIGFLVAGIAVAGAALSNRQLASSRKEGALLKGKVQLLTACLDSRVGILGGESKVALTRYIGTLKSEITNQLDQLSEVYVKSASYFAASSQEYEQARVVQRKDRFAGYVDALLKANVRLEEIVGRLADDQLFLEAFLSRINSGRLDPAMGALELEQIEEVIAKVDEETLNDFVGALRLKRRKAEFDHVMKFRDAMMAAEKRIEQGKAPNVLVARVARKIEDS